MDSEEVAVRHLERARQYTVRANRLLRQRDHWSIARLAAFAAALLAATALIAESQRRGVAAASLAATIATFAALVRYTGQLGRERRRCSDLATINEQFAHKVRRDWARVAEEPWLPATQSHPYASDLDIFGRASLVQLLPPLTAVPGKATLGRWLSEAAPPETVRQRQEAVAELSDLQDFREELAFHALHANAAPERLRRFIDWASTAEPICTNRAVRTAMVTLPALTLLLGTGQLTGVLSAPWWIAPVVASIALSAGFRRVCGTTSAPVADHADQIRGYAAMLRRVGSESFQTHYAGELAHRLASPSAGAEGAFRELDHLAGLAEVRHSPMAFAFLQALLLWDFQVGALVHRWRRRYGARVECWFDTLGEIESLAALAALRHDNPDWTFPVLDGARDRLTAHKLGHPLLPPAVRIDNGVTIGPPGTVLLITGSNMSGKSTLLRAIGLNVVLAQAGAPVCAAALEMLPVRLLTSIRVRDSLEQGISFFMAELERLKLMVEAAESSAKTRSAPVIYLIDEILSGTNSAERAIAAEAIVSRLVSAGALGALTTHDTALMGQRRLAEVAHHMHFRETFDAAGGRSRMYFDYRLREGPSTTRNALALLALVGLADSPPPGP